MFEIESLSSRVNNIVREGTVSEVIAEQHACRVTFEDKDNLVSAVMPVLTLFAYRNKSYALPDVNERVVCLMVSNDLTGGSGYVIGSLYTQNVYPPESDENVTKIEFNDKTYLSYDRRNHEFTLEFADGSNFYFDGSNLEVNIKGRIMINGGSEIDVTARSDINMQGQNIRLN